MPPSKKSQAKAQQKAFEKQAEKIVEDKTFGLKNKNKSKKVQQFVQNVKKVYTGKDDKSLELKRMQQKKDKEDKKKAEQEIQDLFKAVISAPKLAFGEDPKSVLCPFFKAGNCQKGAKCKYSHDLSKLNARGGSAKRDIHTDTRDEKKQETNANWTQEELEKVVASNAARYNTSNQTKIVCKYFLDAIEQEVYGWFWQCPNGKDCKYRHALPDGYVYKSKAEREAESLLKEKDRAIDKSLLKLENIELLRSKLPVTGLTPVTPESFAKWKAERKEKKEQEKQKAEAEQAKKKTTGKEFRLLSGRALFVYNPELFVDDADALDDNDYEVEEAEQTEEPTNEPNYHEDAQTEEDNEVTVTISTDLFEDENLDDLPSDDDDDDDDDDEEEDEEEENNLNETKTTNEDNNNSEVTEEPNQIQSNESTNPVETVTPTEVENPTD